MDDGGVAGVEPAAEQCPLRGLRVAIVTLHDDVATHDDLSGGGGIARDVDAVLIDDAQLARGDQLDTLPGLDLGACRRGEGGVLGARLANADKRGRLGEAVDLRDRPAEFLLDALDGVGGGRRTAREHADAARRRGAQFGARARDRDDHRGGGADHRDALFHEVRIDAWGVGLAQADVGGADGGGDPDEGPAVGVEHRQRPEIPVGARHAVVHEDPDGIYPGVSVGDHHPLGLRGRAAGVIDREEVVLLQVMARHVRRVARQEPLVVVEAMTMALKGDEVLDTGHFVAHGVDGSEVILVHAHDTAPGMIDHVHPVGR